MTNLSLAISPCPNDTYIFGGWILGLLNDSPPTSVDYLDIDQLNENAFLGNADIIKVSFHAAYYLLNDYVLLRSGGALGRGCGPLLLSRNGDTQQSPEQMKIAIPGELTTAAMLLKLFSPNSQQLIVMPFDEIMPAIVEKKVDAGVVIHESRFTFQEYGLRQLVDLGEFWEQSTGLPIPLGGIMMKRSCGRDRILQIESTIQKSIQFARKNPSALSEYIASHAQEMDPIVTQNHINLYVNDFSLNYGSDGEKAIQEVFSRLAETKSEPCPMNVFIN